MTPEELKEIKDALGKQAATEIDTRVKEVEKNLNAKAEDVAKGLMTEAAFTAFKAEQLEPINKMLSQIKDASEAQGIKINAMLEKAAPNSISFEDFLAQKVEQARAKGGGYMEITAHEMKVAGVQSIGSSIPSASPYAPGLAGNDLQLFDVVRNENFITSKVDLGRTNNAILAWANELGAPDGVPTVVAEAGLKPQIQRKFQVETSKAIKIAGWSEFTEEFDQDLPGFATFVRRMLQNDVIRAWDDAVQVFAQTVAKGYQINQLNGEVDTANYWDAIMAQMGQVGFYNFDPNTVAMNWLTNVAVKTQKAGASGTPGSHEYLLPPFLEDIRSKQVYANKMSYGYALTGDLKQIHVDIYKDFVLKVGWINDEFIYNKFAVVGELRYHQYIPDVRKVALCYDYLGNIKLKINGTPGS